MNADRIPSCRFSWLFAVSCAALISAGQIRAQQFADFTPGVAYANDIVPKEPWSIHLVRVDRSRHELELRSAHAMNSALGLSTLTAQIKATKPEWGVPVAGVNGDFYERTRVYAGDPRSLQIIDGEMISSPTTGSTLWIDAAGAPHIAKVESRFTITFPDGNSFPFGLNEDRGTNVLVLHTPAVGASTHTLNTTELILERNGTGAWLPLKVGEQFSARVRELHDGGDTHLTPGIMVLALNPAFAKMLPKMEAGAVLKISTATSPEVRGARMAISGGPVLVHEGKKQDLTNTPKAAGRMGEYSYRSMFERHPRSAVGWNSRYFFLLEVDGRQPQLSVGMTLEEIGEYMIKLGCTEVMNLDGGGSATMYAKGRIVNSPSERNNSERDIANSLLVVRKNISSASTAPEAAK